MGGAGVVGDVTTIQQSGQMSHTAGYFEGNPETCPDNIVLTKTIFHREPDHHHR